MWNYKEVYMPNHPKARQNGCVLEHRLVAEQIIGRILKDEEVVHHIDEDRTNNNLDNLIVFVSQDDHARFHRTGLMVKNEDNTYYSPIVKSNCEKCGEEFNYSENQKRFCTIKCANEFSRKVERPNKDDLEKLIKEKSFVELGRIYGVSDNAVKKWCKSYGLPHRKKDLVS